MLNSGPCLGFILFSFLETRSHYGYQDGLELNKPPASAFQLLRLQVCTPGFLSNTDAMRVSRATCKMVQCRQFVPRTSRSWGSLGEEAALQGHSPQTTDAGHTIQNVTTCLRQRPPFVLELRAAQRGKSPVTTYQ